MGQMDEYIWYLKFQISVKDRQLEAFRNGHKYTSLRADYEAVCRDLKKQIQSLKSELSKAHAETVTVRKNWSEIFDDLEKEHQKETESLKCALADMEKRALRAEAKVDELKDKLTAERREKYEIGERLEEAEGKIQKLTAQVNKDFSNSSIPSSLQGAGRKKIPNSREKTGRSRGGQKGHPGHRLTQKKPTETHAIPDPEEYTEDPDYYKTSEVVKRQKIVLSFDVKIVEYSAAVFRNRKNGSKVHAPFPDGYTTDICYDQSVKAFVYLLANEGNMTVGKIRKILREASHGALDISEATVNDLCSEFAKKSKPEKDKIIADIMTSPVANVDFTNANVNGDAKQVLIIASPSKDAYLYVARDKKGHEGIKGTPAENYVGIFVHDHDTTFYSYGMGHQECGQHVGRYLTGSEENEPNLKWNLQMHELYREMIHYKNSLGGGDADPDIVAGFEKRYDEILSLAEEEYENNPPSDYYREGYNLYRRLLKYKDSHLLFLHNKDVPADNSLAERLARIYKRKQKQAIALRSEEKFVYLCDGLSVINTYRQRDDIDLFEIVTEIFSRPKPKA